MIIITMITCLLVVGIASAENFTQIESYEYDSGTTYYHNIELLDNTHAMVTYRDTTSSDAARHRIISFNSDLTNLATAGTDATIGSSIRDTVITKLNDSHIYMIYKTSSNAMNGYWATWDESYTISLTAAQSIGSSKNQAHGVWVDNTHLQVGLQDVGSGDGYIYSMTFDSALQHTTSSQFEFDTGYGTHVFGLLNSDKNVSFWAYRGTSNYLYFQAMKWDGSYVVSNLGTTTINNSGIMETPWIHKYNDTQFLISYRDTISGGIRLNSIKCNNGYSSCTTVRSEFINAGAAVSQILNMTGTDLVLLSWDYTDLTLPASYIQYDPLTANFTIAGTEDLATDLVSSGRAVKYNDSHFLVTYEQSGDDGVVMSYKLNTFSPSFIIHASDVEILSPNRSQRLQTNMVNISFNVSDNSYNDSLCGLFIGGVNQGNNTYNVDEISYVNDTFPLGVSTYKIGCWNDDLYAESGQFQYDFDNRTPFISSGMPSTFNDTVYNLTFDIRIAGNVTDLALDEINITIWDSEGTVLWSNYSTPLNASQTTYTWNTTVDVTGKADGTYLMFIESDDTTGIADLNGLNVADLWLQFEVDNCHPNWTCSLYEDCRVTGKQYCTTYTDLNSCNETYTAEQIYQSCTYDSEEESRSAFSRGYYQYCDAAGNCVSKEQYEGTMAVSPASTSGNPIKRFFSWLNNLKWNKSWP